MADWRDEAACANDPIPFDDPEPLDQGSIRLRREAEARAICWNKCNVRMECLDDALKDESQSTAYNIRGGRTADERKSMLRGRVRRKKKEMAG